MVIASLRSTSEQQTPRRLVQEECGLTGFLLALAHTASSVCTGTQDVHLLWLPDIT